MDVGSFFLVQYFFRCRVERGQVTQYFESSSEAASDSEKLFATSCSKKTFATISPVEGWIGASVSLVFRCHAGTPPPAQHGTGNSACGSVSKLLILRRLLLLLLLLVIAVCGVGPPLLLLVLKCTCC